jgi:hypothetical protein
MRNVVMDDVSSTAPIRLGNFAHDLIDIRNNSAIVPAGLTGVLSMVRNVSGTVTNYHVGANPISGTSLAEFTTSTGTMRPDYMIGSETKNWGSLGTGDTANEAVTVTGAQLGDIFVGASMSIAHAGLVSTGTSVRPTPSSAGSPTWPAPSTSLRRR